MEVATALACLVAPLALRPLAAPSDLVAPLARWLSAAERQC